MKKMRVNTIYGADGMLRTSYSEGKAVKTARKNVKAFNKQLAKYDKDFINYAMLDIDSSNIQSKNERYIFGKLKIVNDYVDYIPVGDMAESMGEDITAIAGSKYSSKLGIGAKIASKFQPFMEKQAEKHPRLQKLSDCVAKAANGGRMPLTAESAAVMRIAFDKKYYEDSRKPGADKELIKDLHDKAVANLTKMAAYDGVERDELSKKFSEKLIEQLQFDEGLSDVYAGMATGAVRLGPDEPVLNNKGEAVKVKGRTLYRSSKEFVSAERDKNGRNIKLDAWDDLEPREPQSVEVTLADYKAQFDKFVQNCETEADFKRFLASDTYSNLERNARTFAEADCPDEAERFKYEFARANIASCQKWGIDHGYKMPYANMIVPPPYESYAKNNQFAQQYSTSDYFTLDSVAEKAAQDVENFGDDDSKLTESLEQDVNQMAIDADYKALVERMNKLDAENAELKKQLAEQNSKTIEASTSDTVYYADEVTDSPKQKMSAMDLFNGVMNTASVAMNIANRIRDNYTSDTKAVTSTSNLDRLRQHKQPTLRADYEPPKYIEATIVEPAPDSKEYKTTIDDFGLNIDFKEIGAVVIKEDVHISGDEWYDIDHRIYYDSEKDCLMQRNVCPGQPTYEKEISLENANKYINDSLYDNMSRNKTMDVYIEDGEGVRSEIDAKSAYASRMNSVQVGDVLRDQYGNVGVVSYVADPNRELSDDISDMFRKNMPTKEQLESSSEKSDTKPLYLTMGTYSDDSFDDDDDDYDFG